MAVVGKRVGAWRMTVILLVDVNLSMTELHMSTINAYSAGFS